LQVFFLGQNRDKIGFFRDLYKKCQNELPITQFIISYNKKKSMTVSNSFDYFTIKGYNKSKVGKKTKEIGQKRAMAMINYIEKHLKTFSVRPHRHNYWEIIYVTEGEGTIKTANLQVINYKKGELLCIPPYLTHLNDSSTGFKNIHFTIEDWEPNRQEPFLIPQSDFLKDFYSVLKLTYRYFNRVKGTITKLYLTSM
jgi:quercetin dioxygenase-like cupin family protein